MGKILQVNGNIQAEGDSSRIGQTYFQHFTTHEEIKAGEAGTNDLYIKGNIKAKMNGDYHSLLDLIYPVGSVIMTMDKTFEPSAYWGGTWKKWEDGYLKADVTPNATAQGATAYKISKDMLPTHSHSIDHTHTYSFENDHYFIVSGTDETRSKVVKAASDGVQSATKPSVTMSEIDGYDRSYSVYMSDDDSDGTHGSKNQQISIGFNHNHAYAGSSGDGSFANNEYKPRYYAVIAWQRIEDPK